MNGFSLHAATTVKAHERDKLEKLLRYVGRGPISKERLSQDENGNILYKLKYSGDGATHALFSPIELLEKISAIIPPPWRHQVNYYGCLSSHSRLRPLVVSSSVPLQPNSKMSSPEKRGQDQVGCHVEDGVTLLEEKVGQEDAEIEKKSNYIPWATLLARTFNVDLETCGHCGGNLRIIALVMKKAAINEILEHLGLGRDPPLGHLPDFHHEFLEN